MKKPEPVTVSPPTVPWTVTRAGPETVVGTATVSLSLVESNHELTPVTAVAEEPPNSPTGVMEAKNTELMLPLPNVEPAETLRASNLKVAFEPGFAIAKPSSLPILTTALTLSRKLEVEKKPEAFS